MKCLQYQLNKTAKQAIAVQYSHVPLAHVRCFGCQQNANDTERIKGVLYQLGFEFTQDATQADLIVFNTCAVREHAEQRVFGNIGALKNIKQKNPNLLIAICGCMAAEKPVVKKLIESYPHVDIVLGPNPAHLLGNAIAEKLASRKRNLSLPQIYPEIVEKVPTLRDSDFRAYLPIMYGCNNYCSYCIVPYVRGEERSRLSTEILQEFKALVNAGYKEITLLGQNVNSYGKGNEEKLDFSDLLQLLCKVPGNYKIRFMTSHPKDATRKMVDTIAANPKLCKNIHLPVQSGCNDILSKMNRRYTQEDYMALVNYAKETCPEITFSSDIMVGFPGETEENFLETQQLVAKVGFSQLFTFIYSPRPGTKAAKMANPTPHSEKSERLQRLLDVQAQSFAKLAAPLFGQAFTALVEDEGLKDDIMFARLDNNMAVEIKADKSLLGSLVNVKITAAKAAVLQGIII